MWSFALGPARPVIEEIRAAAGEHVGGRLRVSVAWAREEGVAWLLEALEGKTSSVEILIGLNDRGTTVEAILRLLQRADRVAVFFKHRSQTFHPKLYWFDDGSDEPSAATLIVGSSNLTRGGLVTNFEAALVAKLRPLQVPGDKELLLAVSRAWDELVSSPYAHAVEQPEDVERLYRGGYIPLERTLRRREKRAPKAEAALQDLPTSPPPPVRSPVLGRLDIPFTLLPSAELESDVPPDDADPAGSMPLADRFFVRTLTLNDVEKLHGRRSGTFEPNLGELARDTYPSFWGWRSMYRTVIRKLPRLEWKAKGRLFSARAPADGLPCVLTLWYRESRPGHAAEHRLGVGPISAVRSVVPGNFDTSSLLAVERSHEGADYGFVVRLVTAVDPGYDDLKAYLTHARPQHRYGYGP